MSSAARFVLPYVALRLPLCAVWCVWISFFSLSFFYAAHDVMLLFLLLLRYLDISFCYMLLLLLLLLSLRFLFYLFLE